MCTVSEKALGNYFSTKIQSKNIIEVEYDFVAHYKQRQIEMIGKVRDCTEEADYLTNCSY